MTEVKPYEPVKASVDGKAFWTFREDAVRYALGFRPKINLLLQNGQKIIVRAKLSKEGEG